MDRVGEGTHGANRSTFKCRVRERAAASDAPAERGANSITKKKESTQHMKWVRHPRNVREPGKRKTEKKIDREFWSYLQVAKCDAVQRVARSAHLAVHLVAAANAGVIVRGEVRLAVLPRVVRRVNKLFFGLQGKARRAHKTLVSWLVAARCGLNQGVRIVNSDRPSE